LGPYLELTKDLKLAPISFSIVEEMLLQILKKYCWKQMFGECIKFTLKMWNDENFEILKNFTQNVVGQVYDRPFHNKQINRKGNI
jgi:hypothetical protein